MISSIRGKLEARGDGYVVVNVGGVGLQVHVPTSLFDQLGAIGSQVELYTHLHVRENELSLYGCGSEDELQIFKLLLSVSGVGPRVALDILSSLSPDVLRMAIAQENVDALDMVPGIGRKTAKKLIFHLKDKIEVGLLPPIPPLTPADTEVIEALSSLGYSVAEAREALRSLPDEELSVEEKITLALRYFGGA